MLEEKINLMILNGRGIEDVHGTLGMNLFKKCNAMNLTLKNNKINVDKVNECRSLIKNTTNIFSNFRGNNLLTTAVNLSITPYPNESIVEILEVYKKLKEKFFSSSYLVLAAEVIYNAKERISIGEAIEKTKTAYDFMKKNHWFLTNSEDISSAAIIAVNSNNIENTFREIEECYKHLKNNGYWGGNNLQALSHILSLNNLHPKEKCEKVNSIDKALRTFGVSLKGYALPILGIAAFVTNDYNAFAKNVIYTRDKLKKEKGFGIFSLGSLVLNMISVTLVASSYIDEMSYESQDILIQNAHNTSLTMAIAIQIAATTSAAGAAAAASSSN